MRKSPASDPEAVRELGIKALSVPRLPSRDRKRRAAAVAEFNECMELGG
jgi:hypothetical protein